MSERNILPDEEVMALDRVLVRDNKIIVAVEMADVIDGRGGTNTSRHQKTEVYDLKKWSGKPCPVFSYGADLPGTSGLPSYAALLAVVEDVIYIEVHGKVRHAFADKTYYEAIEGIAYDTDWFFRVMALEKGYKK